MTALTSSIPGLVRTNGSEFLALFPDHKKVSNRDGGEWEGPCPKCGGKNRHRAWPNDSKHGGKGFAACLDGDDGRAGCGLSGDYADWLQIVEGLSPREALEQAGASLPANGHGHGNVKKARTGKYLGEHPYRDATGQVIYSKKRWDREQGKCVWVNQPSAPAPLLLYRSYDLLQAAGEYDYIIDDESEKTVDLLWELGIVAVSYGGQDLTRIDLAALAGKTVIVAVDQDRAGEASADKRARAYQAAGAQVLIFRPPALRTGEDLEDWLRRQPHRLAALRKAIRDDAQVWTASTPTAESTAALRLPWLTTDQVKAMPPLEYLIPDMLPKRSLSMLYGPSGAGKSFVALDWAARLACEGRIVLYVCTEGQAGIGKRIAAWEHINGREIPPSGLLQLHQAPNLLDDNQIIALLNDAAILKPDVIILDTLTNMLSAAGADGDKSHDAGRYLTALNRFQQETGAAVLLVHHPTKDGKWERGSGVLRAACDAIIELSNSEGLITVSCSKSKDSAPFADKHYQLIPVESADSCVLVPSEQVLYRADRPLSDNERRALNVLSWPNFIDAGAKSGTIAREARIPEGSIIRVLGSLMRRQLVSQDAKGEPYRLSESGKLLIGTKDNYRDGITMVS